VRPENLGHTTQAPPLTVTSTLQHPAARHTMPRAPPTTAEPQRCRTTPARGRALNVWGCRQLEHGSERCSSQRSAEGLRAGVAPARGWSRRCPQQPAVAEQHAACSVPRCCLRSNCVSRDHLGMCECEWEGQEELKCARRRSADDLRRRRRVMAASGERAPATVCLCVQAAERSRCGGLLCIPSQLAEPQNPSLLFCGAKEAEQRPALPLSTRDPAQTSTTGSQSWCVAAGGAAAAAAADVMGAA
jgi:hypothetical protein